MTKLKLAATTITAAVLAFGWLQLSASNAVSDEVKRSTNQPANGTSQPAVADESSQMTERQVFMRTKLLMVQKIVEGIATEDFEMVEKGGVELVALAETAAWKSTRDPFYRHYSANFEQAAKGLIAAAKSESVEKATFAYVHVTISCTACHQHVRNTVRTAR